MAELTAEQTEKLLQFQDLTGIEDIENCRELLETHNWDIEIAVQDRFNHQEGIPSAFHQERHEREPPVNANPPDQQVYLIPRHRPQGVIQWGYFVIMFPFRFVYSTVYDIMRFIVRLFRPDPRRYVTDPVGDVVSFITTFNEKYGNQHPTFYQGTYSQALNDAKRELRFLLVYLHGDDHQDTETFCRQSLCNAEVTEYVNTNMFFWACSVNSPEGYRVSQALRENTYPFLAVVVLRENRMTVVARIEGPIDPENLIQRLVRVVEENEASIVAARAERDERSFNQSLRQEQDQAYEESLRADQEKVRKKREEQEQIERQEEAQRQEEEEKHQKQQSILQRKDEIRQCLSEEPSADDPDAIRLLVKLPNGTRLERRFFKSHSLKELHNFIFCQEETPDDFIVVRNFPRKTLPCTPSVEHPDPITFEEAGLSKSEMLLVIDNDA